MADDKLVVNNQEAPSGGENNSEPADIAIDGVSDGVSARKTGKDEITLDIGGDVLRKIRKSMRGPAAAAGMAIAASATPAQEPVDIFDDSAKTEKAQPQALPDDLPKEGRDYALRNEPTRIYNDDQDAAAEDMQKNKAKNPYLQENDGLALKDADIGQFDDAKGIAAADNDSNATPQKLSSDEQENEASTQMASERNETAQTNSQRSIEESEKGSGGKVDLSRGKHSGMINKIPGISIMIDRADSLVQKSPQKAAKLYGKAAFITKNFERFSAIKNIVQFVVATSETVVIPIILILLSPILIPLFIVLIYLKPEWLSPDTREIHELTVFFNERKNKAKNRHKQLQRRKTALAQTNNFNSSVEGRNVQAPPQAS